MITTSNSLLGGSGRSNQVGGDLLHTKDVDRSWIGSVLGEPQVRSRAMIIGEVTLQQRAKVPSAENDHVLRLEMPGFELPPQLEPVQREFDAQMSALFDGMADRMEGIANPNTNHLPEAFERLEEAAKASDATASAHLSDFVALSRTAEQLALSVAQDVQQ